jgi:hypothetical protein
LYAHHPTERRATMTITHRTVPWRYGDGRAAVFTLILLGVVVVLIVGTVVNRRAQTRREQGKDVDSSKGDKRMGGEQT